MLYKTQTALDRRMKIIDISKNIHILLKIIGRGHKEKIR
jgi:hypothetical protein